MTTSLPYRPNLEENHRMDNLPRVGYTPLTFFRDLAAAS